MDLILKINWHEMLVPQNGLLDIFVRGTFIYLFLLALLRIFRRPGVAVPDLLVIVLLADASQNAMAAEYKSITEGALLVSTILFWSYVTDWLEFHVPFVRRLLEPVPVALVKDGKLLRKNMRRELITLDELMTQVRQNGIEDLAHVKRACLESNGEVSVIPVDPADSGGTATRKAGV